MKRKIQFVTALLFWAWIVPAAWAGDSKMIHIVFRIVDPLVPVGHFALAPKEMWRLGSRYMRLEEAPDPDRGIHGLVIVDEPHIFIINRTNNQGMHILDPGPTFNVHMPIFPFPESSDIYKLEFGHEWEFFEQRKARSMPNVKDGDKRYKSYLLEIDGARLILFVDEATGQPAQLSLQAEKAAYVIHYETHETGLEPDMNLFKVPAGVKISEAEQQPSQ